MRVVTAFLFLAWFSVPAPGAEVLTLAEFLSQVKTGNEGYRGAELSRQAALGLAKEGALNYSFSLLADFKASDDSRQQLNPLFQGTRTIYDSYSLGVEKLTSFGLSARLLYTLGYTSIINASPAGVPRPRTFDAAPRLELSQSLWRNFLGRETNAQMEAAEAAAAAQGFRSQFEVQKSLADAEGAYRRLQIARETVKLQIDSLERAGKIREWNLRRVKLLLADRSDLFQAEAGLKVRELELQAARDEAAAAAREVNSLRGKDSAEVSEEMEPLAEDILKSVGVPQRAPQRADVLAAEQLQKATVASALAGLEKNSPSLNIVGSFSLTGREPLMGDAVDTSFSKDHPFWQLGVSFKMPLDIGALSDVREGYARSRDGAELQYKRKLFEQEREWVDVVQRLDDAKRKFSLVNEIEQAQKVKLNHERERLRRGQSLTYQVLLFEQDYLNAQLMRLRIIGEILTLVAKMKLFGGV